MTKKVEICSNALILLGHTPISSLDEPGAGALLAKNLYDTTYEAFLSSNNWNFAKKYAGLNRLSDEPLHPNYKYQYQIPVDFVRINTTIPISDYEIFEDKIYSNSEELGIKYFYKVREEMFPPFAIRCMEYYMASILAIPLTVDTAKANVYGQMFQQQLINSMSIDAQSAPQEGWASTPIADVRYS